MKQKIEYPHLKYELLNQGLKALAQGTINLLILKGEAGWGKTHTTRKFLKENKTNFAYINNYTTALEFYRLLYENRNREIVIIDDTHNVGDLKIIAMLKGACWNVLGEEREIGYHTTAEIFKKLKLPPTFIFKPKIVLIMNEDLPNFEPIIDRGVKIEFFFTYQEKLKIFEYIKKDAGISDEVLSYIKKNCSEATINLSIRSAITLTNLALMSFNWHLFATEILAVDGEKQAILDLVSKCHRIEDATKEWTLLTGKSRRTFFRYYKKMGGKNLKMSKEPTPEDISKAEIPQLEIEHQLDLPEYVKGGEKE